MSVRCSIEFVLGRSVSSPRMPNTVSIVAGDGRSWYSVVSGTRILDLIRG